MSDIVLPPNQIRETREDSQPKRPDRSFAPNVHTNRGTVWIRRIRRSLALLATVILSPLRLFLAVRRSMTGASATLLIVSIISLNIIWGYPWIGMFSACASLMVVGMAVNQFTRPRLKVDFSLARLCPAGEPFSVVTHLANRRQLPAMDLQVGFQRQAKFKSASAKTCVVVTPDHAVDLISPRGHLDLSGFLQFEHRGIQTLPDIVVKSSFPFYLFQSTTRVSSDTTIAITPRPLTGDEDEMSREVLQSLGGWSHKLLAGDALDYTGSREYQVGMPVRRWDFASWARLGRPIVREFQSPSVQMVSLLVDTSMDDASRIDADELLERLLSLAASAIADLASKSVRVRLYITHEELTDRWLAEFSKAVDSDSLLIRLAGAMRVSAQVADDHTRDVLDRVGNDPVLILTTRARLDAIQQAGRNVTLLRVDRPHEPSGRATAEPHETSVSVQASVANGGSG